MSYEFFTFNWRQAQAVGNLGLIAKHKRKNLQIESTDEGRTRLFAYIGKECWQINQQGGYRKVKYP